ncbi:outer membrane protein OmpU [Paraburkholderia sp. BL18I3N2]|uniref:porin n=1 Tax=Paraburkholderia sp. BL18I3N2 TaxID=1938799 RepID=UPI000D42F6EF|nr:porin [Paraburkholderia sp. BL18I3N2]PRX27317.1 outer membrane protein OmpU [Paraburkholderia sp. BL18I3N2]
MKKNVACFAVSSLLSISALAQSSVTLYGALDEAVVYANNARGAHTMQMLDSYHWNTAFGVNGTEDLGGGLKAIFDLASYFNLSNGKMFRSDTFFSRSAWVGLSKDEYGKVTFGHHNDYSILLLANSPGFNSTFSQTPANADHIGGGYLNNAITYRSPTMSGFTFSALYALPGGTSDTYNRGRAFSFALIYEGKRLRAATVATKIKGVNFTPTLAGMKTFLEQTVTPYRSYAVDSQNIYGASASYTIADKWTAGLSYTDVAFAGFGKYESLRSATADVIYEFQPDLKSTLGYARDALGSGRLSNYSLFIDKFLSKRTDIYLGVSLAVASGATQSAVLFPLTPSSTNRQLAVAAGLRTFF